MKVLKPVFLGVLPTSALLLAAGCNGGGSSSTSTTTTTAQPDCVNCSAITPENFVSALVQLGQAGTINANYANSKLVKNPSDVNGDFVIWNGDTQSYQAIFFVSLESGLCTSPGSCSNLNPQTTAEALVNGVSTPHTKAVTTITTSASGQTYTSITYVPDGGTYTLGTAGSGTANSQPVVLEDVGAIPLQPTNQNDSQGNPTFTDPYNDGLIYSQANATRDTDLQQAQLQQTSQLKRAAQLSAGLQMNFTSAVQLTQLADTIQMVQAKQTQLTSDDRAAVMQRLQGIAGVTQDELAQAVQGGLQGDMTASNAMIEKISTHLGMPAGTLRDKVLPQLGLQP